ncbi:MAG TPA: virulence protein RhuM/Fic/DOC family protein [Candidatus Moranbacteria bacterium]|nr:virulence protein RhuM/Fic/DOC family protein [Candidatus Moranbacteria bacterium]HRY28183.1 virulence protein RhuM/Fic/DOC family protein [Candidatus Moranbacteria bacterium]HSA08294.1 virulence protein RhuM/Fic/DOC family protein [Candidatus Moranbacteria bacterium]
MKKEVIIYQGKSGAIELKGDFKRETIWASLDQIADVFERDKSVISRHLKNIYKEKELDVFSTVAKNATVQIEGKRKVERVIEYYNLDAIISVGYRVNSKRATEFRKWATKTLRQHIIQGYTINRKQIGKNYDAFLKAVEDVKKLLPSGGQVGAGDALELMKAFASTWFSLEAYDKESLPKKGATKKQIKITANEISKTLLSFRAELIAKKEAGDLFGIERTKESVAGIVGNVFQTFGKKELYPTLEDKAAHLLYFMVKNHPFVDGNKRSGAFAFVWFLKKARILDMRKITPEALTALTLLVAESNPKDKDRMIGIILLLLK